MNRVRIGFEKGSAAAGVEYTGSQNADGTIVASPDGIGKAFHVPVGQAADGFERFANDAEDGPFYGKAAVWLEHYPDDADECLYMAENGVESRIGVVLDSDGTLFLHEGGPGFAVIGDKSPMLSLHERHIVELGYTNNPALGTTKIEAKLDGKIFASTTLTGTAGQVNIFGWGRLVADASLDIYYDDIVINDGFDAGDGNNTWPGEGRLRLFKPTVLDQEGNDGWTGGGLDLGDVDSVAPTPPTWDDPVHTWDETDDDSFLVAASDDLSIDFRVTSPYSLGIAEEDFIKGISANVRWACASPGGLSQLELYIRAGSNLTKLAKMLVNESDAYHNGNGEESSADPISTSFLPEWPKRWTTEELSGLRIGMRSVDSTPAIHVSSLWGYIEYVPNETPTFELIVDGEDRSTDLENQTLAIDDIVNEQANTASIGIADLHDLGAPQDGSALQLLVNGVLYFSGYITETDHVTLGPGRDRYDCQVVDHTRDLDRRLVAATYTGLTDKQIVERLVSEFAAGDNITTYHVAEGVLIPSISFNYISFTAAMKKICERTGRNWYIDYERDIHYFPLAQVRGPFDIDATTNKQQGLVLTKNGTNIKNRIFVRGATELSAPFTETQAADGQQRQFLLAEKAHNFSMTIDGVAQNVGIKNIDDADSFDYLLNFEEKYVEAGNLTTTAIAGAEVALTYQYDVPILVSVEDSASIAEQAALGGGSGVFEYVITDTNITTTQEARDRATAELTDYARSLVEGSFLTVVAGWRSGQYLHINLTNKGVDDDYLVQRVRLTSISGGRFESSVQLTSAKSIGIITFLISLLTANRASEAFDAEEVVDQLLGVTDALDSITDSESDSMGGTAAKWSNDAGTTTDKARYDLSQWK